MAVFLVSAMRLLTELLPDDKAIPSRRGPYLRSRLHGTDIDPFALELARLSLTLTDIPNPNGWDLRLKICLPVVTFRTRRRETAYCLPIRRSVTFRPKNDRVTRTSYLMYATSIRARKC